jgi:hypothetical protein
MIYVMEFTTSQEVEMPSDMIKGWKRKNNRSEGKGVSSSELKQPTMYSE